MPQRNSSGNNFFSGATPFSAIFDSMLPAEHSSDALALLSAANSALSDKELILSFLEGKQAHFAVLVSRHISMVYKFSYRYMNNTDDANDVAQEVFIKVWKHIKKFDTDKNFKTWLLTITKNTALDFIKKKKPLLFSKIEATDIDLDAFLAPYVENPSTPDVIFDQNQAGVSLHAALQTLPLPYRSVLLLRYTEHLKFREIAAVLEEPIDTVKSKHRRGLVLLRKAFEALSPAART